MGLLAIAGMVSGAGNAVNKGLNAMQDDIRRAGLSQEDRDFQMKKLQIQQDFEGQRERRGYAHTEQMAKQNQGFQTGLHEGDRAAASAEKEIDRTHSSLEKDKDRGLEGRKLDIAADAQKSLDEYHKAIGSYYKDAKGRASDKPHNDLPDSKKELAKQHGEEAKHFFKLAETSLDDKQKDGYIKAGKAALSKGYALLGEAPEDRPVDPFGTSPLSGKSGAAEPAPKSPGILSKVPSEPAAPPMSYDQRVEEQLLDPRFNQLKRYFDRPSGPPALPSPGVNLPNAR